METAIVASAAIIALVVVIIYAIAKSEAKKKFRNSHKHQGGFGSNDKPVVHQQ